MARDDLDDEEREHLEKFRAERSKRKQEDDFEIEVGDKEGNYARIPYSKGRNWLRSKGIEIDDEPDEDPGEDEDEGKPAKQGKGQAKQGSNVRAFRAGRRISLEGAPHLKDK